MHIFISPNTLNLNRLSKVQKAYKICKQALNNVCVCVTWTVCVCLCVCEYIIYVGIRMCGSVCHPLLMCICCIVWMWTTVSAMLWMYCYERVLIKAVHTMFILCTVCMLLTSPTTTKSLCAQEDNKVSCEPVNKWAITQWFYTYVTW